MKNKRCYHDWYHIGITFEGILRQKDFDLTVDWAGCYVCLKCWKKEKERPKGDVKGIRLATFLKKLKEKGDE